MKVHELFAYLCVSDTGAAIDFYRRAFGAEEKFRLVEPGGRIGHAEIEIDGVVVMLCDPFPEYGIQPPQPGSGTCATIHLHVDDADAAIASALKAGATVDSPLQDQFYGERSGSIRDPFGHRWNIGHAIEQLEPAEMQRRYLALFGK